MAGVFGGPTLPDYHGHSFSGDAGSNYFHGYLGLASIEMKIAVCYLYRGNLKDYINFIDAYKKWESGISHDLFLLDKYRHITIPGEMRVPRIGRDLATYGYASRKLTKYSHLVFLNSYSVPQCHQWLSKLVEPFHRDYSLTGCSASFETFRQRDPVRQLIFPRYPNAHLRTNAFAISSELMRSIWPPTIALMTKAQCHYFESGRNNLTKRVQNLGLKVGVVDRDGVVDINSLSPLQTIRCRSDFLVSDNRTQCQ